VPLHSGGGGCGKGHLSPPKEEEEGGKYARKWFLSPFKERKGKGGGEKGGSTLLSSFNGKRKGRKVEMVPSSIPPGRGGRGGERGYRKKG